MSADDGGGDDLGPEDPLVVVGVRESGVDLLGGDDQVGTIRSLNEVLLVLLIPNLAGDRVRVRSVPVAQAALADDHEQIVSGDEVGGDDAPDHLELVRLAADVLGRHISLGTTHHGEWETDSQQQDDEELTHVMSFLDDTDTSDAELGYTVPTLAWLPRIRTSAVP